MPIPKDLTHEIRRSLLDLLGQELKRERSELDARASFHRLGLDSIAPTRLMAALAERVGVPLSPVLAWRCPTIDALVDHVVRRKQGEAGESTDPERARWYQRPELAENRNRIG